MKLAHKGLILVAVPLAFEFLFVSALFILQQAAEDEAQRQAQAKEIAAITGDLSRNLVDASTCLAIWHVTRSDTYVTRYDQVSKDIPRLYDQLEKLTADKPSLAAKVARLRKYGDKMLYLTSNFRRQSDPSILMVRNTLELRHEIEICYRHYMAEEETVTEELKHIQNPQIESEKKSRVKLLLAAGVVFNIVLTGWLALFFSRNITRRLAVLTDNNLRLSRNQELLAPISGEDEIADLDKGFHSMAEALDAAQRRKQEFVQMISHDLRTPLTSIQGTLAAALRGIYGSLNERGVSRIGEAEHSAESLIRLINELLDIEKLEAGMMQIDRQPIDLADVVELAAGSVAAFAEEHGITLDTTQAKQAIAMEGDSDRLVRVLTNLLSNAIKYSDKGTAVKVSSDCGNGTATVRVSDHGRGIAESEKESIFDRFRQVEKDDERKGSGLGLSICKAIVEAHGGTIGVESRLGEGSTFWFSLPAKRSTSAQL